jgi:hypothetical protein
MIEVVRDITIKLIYYCYVVIKLSMKNDNMPKHKYLPR